MWIAKVALRTFRQNTREFSNSCRINQIMRRGESVDDLFESIINKDRYALSRAITLAESTNPEHREKCKELMSLVYKHSNQLENASKHFVSKDAELGTIVPPLNPSFRIGLSGSPGVGKSSFIETFGMDLIEKGHRVAVLAIDPSSVMTGGSILGDKTRMTELSRNEDAYVRPSPSSGTLGGVSRSTNEAILLCETAGFDVILVETVGVGQSETVVAEMVDMFALLVPPGGGDELQGLKKGIVEQADLVIINKADGQLKIPAQMTQIEYVSALKLLRPRYGFWRPKVLQVSSLEKRGIDECWKSMLGYYISMLKSHDFEKKRINQRRQWMWRIIIEKIVERIRNDPKVDDLVLNLETRVKTAEIAPSEAAQQILDAFHSKSKR